MESASPLFPLPAPVGTSGESSGPPLVSIRAGRRLQVLPVLELWSYRELFVFLIWRDLKLRYKQTALGLSWAVLQPLLSTSIISIFFGHFPAASKAAPAYHDLYVFTGILPWTFLSNCVTAASNSLLRDTNLVTKVYVPRVILPAAT